MQFEFLGKKFRFFGAQTVNTASFSIQTAIFEFKLKTWTNKRMSRRYGSSTPVAVGTAPALGIKFIRANFNLKITSFPSSNSLCHP
jgi:hypothetical protein